MNNITAEADFYRTFLQREAPLLEDLLYNTDVEHEAAYEYAVLKLNAHFSTRFDNDEIRELLGQDPETDGRPHSLASLFFAQAASELQIRLIENSIETTCRLIGPIVGIDVPQTLQSLPSEPTIEGMLALYRALPENKRAVFHKVVTDKMEPR